MGRLDNGPTERAVRQSDRPLPERHRGEKSQLLRTLLVPAEAPERLSALTLELVIQKAYQCHCVT